MSNTDDFGIIEYLGEKLMKKGVKLQRKIQGMKNQNSNKQGVLEEVQESQVPEQKPQISSGGRYVGTPTQSQPTSLPVQQDRQRILSGNIIKDVGDRMRNIDFLSAREEKNNRNNNQESRQQPKRRRIIQPKAEQMSFEEQTATNLRQLDLDRANKKNKGMSLQ